MFSWRLTELEATSGSEWQTLRTKFRGLAGSNERAGAAQWPPNRSDITTTLGSQAWFRQGSPKAASMDLSKEKLV